MQEVLLNYCIRVLLAENPKEMVKQANLKQIKFCNNSGWENVFLCIHRNLSCLLFWSNLKKQIWSNLYCRLDPPCKYVEFQ